MTFRILIGNTFFRLSRRRCDACASVTVWADHVSHKPVGDKSLTSKKLEIIWRSNTITLKSKFFNLLTVSHFSVVIRLTTINFSLSILCTVLQDYWLKFVMLDSSVKEETFFLTNNITDSMKNTYDNNKLVSV